MSDVKEIRAALLGDVVSSRLGDRRDLHRAVLSAVDVTNARVAPLDTLRPTVGDEVQGVYADVTAALAASFTLRLHLAPEWDVRFGVGVGGVEVIDESLGIQDGPAWWRAREALDWVRELSERPGHESARTAIRDPRPGAAALMDATVRLVDAHLAGLRPGTLRTLRGLWAGDDNATVAASEGISESANSQRVRNNHLRPLLDAMETLSGLR